MKKQFIKSIYIVTLFVLILSACDKDFLDVSNPNRLTEDQLKTPSGIRQLEVGMYDHLGNVYNYDYQTMHNHLPGEYEFVETTGEGQHHKGAWEFNANPSNNIFVHSIYSGLYWIHPNANRIITYLEQNEGTVDQLPEREFNLILGSAYFLRAYSHFVLLHMYGRPFDGTDRWGIIINDKIVFIKEDYEKPRSKPSEVYAFIESDLKKAKEILLKSSELLPAELGRPTRGAATALLGKLYVFRKEYDKAAAEFELFLSENPDKELLPYFGDNFNGSSDNGPESIFEIQWADLLPNSPWGGGGPANHFQIYVGGHGMGRDNVSVPEEIMAGFDPRDIRFSETVYSAAPPRIYVYHGDTIALRDTLFFLSPPARVRRSARNTYTPKKFISNYRSATNTGGVANDVSYDNQPVIRLAEVYLLHAEALAKLNRVTEASEFLNRVMRRARGYWYYEVSPFDYTGNDQEEFMALLMEEKRKEFIGEQVRWWDVLRWGIVENEVARIPGRLWHDRGQAFPIPTRDISTNPFMEQNPGY
jgi:starch-binding outer membrane protein, SusD/RagB family